MTRKALKDPAITLQAMVNETDKSSKPGVGPLTKWNDDDATIVCGR